MDQIISFFTNDQTLAAISVISTGLATVLGGKWMVASKIIEYLAAGVKEYAETKKVVPNADITKFIGKNFQKEMASKSFEKILDKKKLRVKPPKKRKPRIVKGKEVVIAKGEEATSGEEY